VGNTADLFPERVAARRLLVSLLNAALSAADPLNRVPPFLPEPPAGRTVVLGASKAAARMAQAVEKAWSGPLDGLVVTRYGHGAACERIKVTEAGHPVPDDRAEHAARRVLALASGLGEDDLMIALISGGGSALLALPADGITLDDKKRVTTELLRSGAPIREINIVRKHMSGIKGGRLAAAAFPARTVGLLISDVAGDAPAAIASGPTVAESSHRDAALAVLDRYGVEVPGRVRALLSCPAWDGAPRPGDVRMSRTVNHLIATPQVSLEAASAEARRAGVTPVILSDSVEGEARDVGSVLAAIARQVRRYGQPVSAPCVILTGGETTVTVRGTGTGGPNAEFLLSLAVALDGEPGIYALAADTDGIDGMSEVAGAFVAPDTLPRARAAGADPAASLAANDAHEFFTLTGDQVITGPTLTNVNDFRAILIT
jgi:hydroxypyruvate reductase